MTKKKNKNRLWLFLRVLPSPSPSFFIRDENNICLVAWRFSRFHQFVPTLKVSKDGVLDQSNSTYLLIWLLQGNETLRTFHDTLFESAS